MPQQEIDVVLEAVASRLTTVLGPSPGTAVIAGVHTYQVPSISAFPSIVLNYLDSPWEFGPSGRNQIQHRIEVQCIVSPKAQMVAARKQAASLIRDVKNALMAGANGGIELIAAPNQTTVMGSGSQWLRNLLYPQGVPAERQNQYLAAGIIFNVSELTGETL